MGNIFDACKDDQTIVQEMKVSRRNEITFRGTGKESDALVSKQSMNQRASFRAENAVKASKVMKQENSFSTKRVKRQRIVPDSAGSKIFKQVVEQRLATQPKNTFSIRCLDNLDFFDKSLTNKASKSKSFVMTEHGLIDKTILSERRSSTAERQHKVHTTKNNNFQNNGFLQSQEDFVDDKPIVRAKQIGRRIDFDDNQEHVENTESRAANNFSVEKQHLRINAQGHHFNNLTIIKADSFIVDMSDLPISNM